MSNNMSFGRKLNATMLLAMLSVASLAATALLDSASAATVGRGGNSSSGPSGPAGGSGNPGGNRNGATFLPQASANGIICPITQRCPPPPPPPVVQTQVTDPSGACTNGVRWIRDYYGTWLRVACEPRVWPQEYISSWND